MYFPMCALLGTTFATSTFASPGIAMVFARSTVELMNALLGWNRANAEELVRGGRARPWPAMELGAAAAGDRYSPRTRASIQIAFVSCHLGLWRRGRRRPE